MADHLPTDEQLVILGCQDSRIAIVAAAGAGKTWVLVERYLAHVLEEKIDPDKILTITFTRKAAAEMKSRIVKGLRKAGAYEEAQIAETGPIQTIHSLCEQLLRENAISAGIDAKFEILSDAQATRLQHEVAEEAIATIEPEFHEAERLIGSLAGKRSYSNSSPYSLLQSSILSGLDAFRGIGLDRERLEGIYSTPECFHAHWRESVLSAQPSPVRITFETTEGPDWRANLRQSYRTLRTAVPPWLRVVPSMEEDFQLERTTCGLAQLVIRAWRLLDERMTSTQAFDFTDLESFTVRLLESNPHLRQRLANKFEVVMIDEAQDLNPNQYRLLELIGCNRKLTVGDGQQSIYGFRHADLDQFELSHSIDAKRLTKNHRSSPGILNFVDKFFLATWGDRYVPMSAPPIFDLDDLAPEDFTGVEFWEFPSINLTPTAPYIGRLIDEREATPGEICVLTRDSKACQTIHEELAEKGIESRIVGGSERFYTRMEVRDLANTLRALADPYHDFSLLAVLRGPAVNLSEEAIFRLGLKKPIIDNYSEVELLGEDRRKLEAFLEWFVPLRAYADRLSAWEVLSEIFASTPFLRGIAQNENGPQQVANVRKLLLLASQDSHLGPLEFADQIRDIQLLKHKEGDAEDAHDQSNAVTLMTIHKSKGLEFPVVVLADTNNKFTRSSSDIYSEPKLELLSAHFGGIGKGLLHKFLEERKKTRELEEEMRVLYVAMTRAKRKLCIAIYPPTSHDTVSKRIKRVIGDPPPDSIKVRVPLQSA